jgi:triacylglycerol lipase
MSSRTFWIVAVLLQWGLALGWLLYVSAHGHLGLAVLGALLLTCWHVPVIALEYLAIQPMNRQDPAPRATWRDAAHAWREEIGLAFKLFGWWMPWRSRKEPDNLGADAPGRRGVVLLHAWLCNRGLWNGWMPRLRAVGVPFVAVDLNPVQGPIERYVATVHAAVEQVIAATGRPPLIVCHSMGGLAARAWMRHVRQLPDAQREALRIHGLVTLGTPHQGTAGGWLPMANVAQMRLGSDWLGELARGETPEMRQAMTCFYSHTDNIVFPASSATLPHADNRHIPATAHMKLIEREEPLRFVLDKLGEPDARPAPPAPPAQASQASQADSMP